VAARQLPKTVLKTLEQLDFKSMLLDIEVSVRSLLLQGQCVHMVTSSS
jgi:hypothetical protein